MHAIGRRRQLAQGEDHGIIHDREKFRRIRAVVDINTIVGVKWLHSFLSADKRKTYCLYEAESGDAIREAARRAGLPADIIIELTGELRPEALLVAS